MSLPVEATKISAPEVPVSISSPAVPVTVVASPAPPPLSIPLPVLIVPPLITSDGPSAATARLVFSVRPEIPDNDNAPVPLSIVPASNVTAPPITSRFAPEAISMVPVLVNV